LSDSRDLTRIVTDLSGSGQEMFKTLLWPCAAAILSGTVFYSAAESTNVNSVTISTKDLGEEKTYGVHGQEYNENGVLFLVTAKSSDIIVNDIYVLLTKEYSGRMSVYQRQIEYKDDLAEMFGQNLERNLESFGEPVFEQKVERWIRGLDVFIERDKTHVFYIVSSDRRSQFVRLLSNNESQPELTESPLLKIQGMGSIFKNFQESQDRKKLYESYTFQGKITVTVSDSDNTDSETTDLVVKQEILTSGTLYDTSRTSLTTGFGMNMDAINGRIDLKSISFIAKAFATPYNVSIYKGTWVPGERIFIEEENRERHWTLVDEVTIKEVQESTAYGPLNEITVNFTTPLRIEPNKKQAIYILS